MSTSSEHPTRWIIAVAAALAVVALLIWADREAGIDDRDTDPDHVTTSSQPASDEDAG